MVILIQHICLPIAGKKLHVLVPFSGAFWQRERDTGTVSKVYCDTLFTTLGGGGGGGANGDETANLVHQ